MKKGLILLFGVLALAVPAAAAIRELAIVNEALAVVVGVICGIAAAIPTSILLLLVLTQSERRQLDAQGRIERLEAAGCQVEESRRPDGRIVYIVSAEHSPMLRAALPEPEER